MFDLQGHRFARGLLPENTLEGLAGAVALGLDSFEIDVAITRDGVPVVHHDPALNPNTTRDAGGSWLQSTGPLIRDLTMAELAVYDVGRLRPGSAYAATYSSQQPRDGARIPTLEAVLRFRPALRFNIELKIMPAHPEWTVSAEEMVERTLHVVDAAQAGPRVTIQSFDWRAPRHVRRVRPEMACGWLTEPSTVAASPLWWGLPAGVTIESVPDAIAAEGGGTWTPHYADLAEPSLARAHVLGLRVIPWTVNDPADMRRLLAWGVDGLITDWPDRALALHPAGS